MAQLASEANVFAHAVVSSVTRDKSSCSSFGKLRNTMASSASPKRSQCEKETDRKLDDAGEAHRNRAVVMRQSMMKSVKFNFCSRNNHIETFESREL